MFQNLWQVLFQLQTRLGTWLCMFALLAALASFAVALKNVDTYASRSYTQQTPSSKKCFGLLQI